MADEKDVKQESSPALAEAIAGSPAAQEQIEQQAQEAQTPAKEEETQEQGEQQTEEPRVPYSRFKDVVEEKNWYKTQLEQRFAQQSQTQPPQPTTPQEIGNTPEEREFWRMQRQIAREEAERVSREQIGKLNPVIDAGRQELAMLKVQQFRNQHPDVKPNSPEEMAIAERISSGYLPEDAYKVVMYDRKLEQSEKQANIQAKQKIEAKKQANVEQRSIPQGATLPTKEKLSLDERLKQAADKLDWS